ncbi:U32 family peptidase [Shewanella sp. NIFS-20-20]|uniref:U32 family peptidase n=1 Tax=Shewanella sp. NIFS-20-20 TaxID=2853806 RepID=UPI001C454986|nr:U32 family peptidase [Shewanella sp. NIFS-20-20]MBV7314948.1 U32 family peptidase [Shewanella sp. NIFS-20-20]
MKVSLGPLLYCWDKVRTQAFYQAVGASDIPLVYLGEAVCNRRRQLKFKDYWAIAQDLRDSGKQVILTTQALIEAGSALVELKKIIDNGEFMIEANDMAAVAMAREAKVGFIAGAEINHYNPATLTLLQQFGMQRFVMPYELDQQWLSKTLAANASLKVEVLGLGHLPLAHSARCFTAKQAGLNKDTCATLCINYPQGITIKTQEQQALLRLNGIQTQSATRCNLSQQWQQMQQLGVEYFRVSADSEAGIAQAQALLKHQVVAEQDIDSNGYWFGQSGMSRLNVGNAPAP